jgi:hypothetical protein
MTNEPCHHGLTFRYQHDPPRAVMGGSLVVGLTARATPERLSRRIPRGMRLSLAGPPYGS